MTSFFQLTPAADADLDDQAAYLAREAGIDTALRFYDAAARSFSDLARMPGMGELRPSANLRLAGLRVWRIGGFEGHLIFYRQIQPGIEIIRVLHAARDINNMLELDD